MEDTAISRYEEIIRIRQKFPEVFFNDEIRDGFFIESKMKRAWAAQIEVLMEIDKICERNGIEYFAYGGTLLGAVRHKGFIPWDEDIDIAMRREDYQKFLGTAKKELPKGWRLMGAAQGDRFFFSRVVNGQGYDSSAENLLRFHGCPYTVGVDIFPLDYLPSDREEEDVLYFLLRSIYSAIGAIKAGGKKELEELLKLIEQTCCVSIEREEKVEEQLCQLMDAIGMLYVDDRTDTLATLMFSPNPEVRMKYKREWVEKTVRLPFETIMIPVPANHHAVLEVQFGEGYMTPIRELPPDYPFYNKYEKELKKLNYEKKE